MAMRNPYSAYQKFAKKNPAKPTGTASETTTSTPDNDTQTQAPAMATPSVTPALASVREGFQPQRQKPLNPKMYEMKKNATLKGEHGQERVKTVEMEEANLEQPATEVQTKPVEKKAVNPYLQSKVMTASPEELVLMLYDGAIRFMNQAVVHLEAENKPSAHESSLRAQAIVAELMGSLNMDIEISKNLMSLYDYLQYVMVGANIEKDAEKSRHAIELLRELRETWQEAMKLHKAGK